MGVLQGDAFAPFLFIIVLDYILTICMSPDYGLTIIPRQSRRLPAVTVTDLDFADNLALHSNSIQDTHSILRDLEVAADKVGLSMSVSKTVNIDSEETSEETSEEILLSMCVTLAYSKHLTGLL